MLEKILEFWKNIIKLANILKNSIIEQMNLEGRGAVCFVLERNVSWNYMKLRRAQKRELFNCENI